MMFETAGESGDIVDRRVVRVLGVRDVGQRHAILSERIL